MHDDARPGSQAPQAEHVRFLFDPHATLTAFAGQRRRFASTVTSLSAEELAAPSRCRGWSVADVLRHLVWADGVVRQLWTGDMSPVAGFDPRTTPDAAVRADRVVPDTDTPGRYVASTDTMVAAFEGSGPERFGDPGITPLGRVPWWMSAVHLGWDSTVHERDVLMPLGRPVEDVAAERQPALAYSLVLASFFGGDGPLDVQVGGVRLQRDATAATTWAVPAHDGDGTEADGGGDGGGGGDDGDGGVTVLGGDALCAIDALCGRGVVDDALAGDETTVYRLGGLARYFTAV